jgi:hypothetical protein
MIHHRQQVRRGPARRVDRPAAAAPEQTAAEGMIILYDHTATFELTGRPGNIVQDVINVGSDGVFVATAIGYGFEEQRARAILNPAGTAPATGAQVVPGDATLGQIPLAALIEGFRISPRFAPLVFADRATGHVFTDQPLAGDLFFGSTQDRSVLEKVKTPADISFTFSIVDGGTGREFQDQPAHNLASLGRSNGQRPFRWLARPLSFLPRSTLRLQVAERTEGAQGTLFIVLYGYKILNSACSEPALRAVQAEQAHSNGTYGEADPRTIPFDYVTTFELTGNPGQLIEDEVSVNVEGGFVATSIGYGLAVDSLGVTVEFERIPDILDLVLRNSIINWSRTSLIDLNKFPLRLFPASALRDGIRIRPDFLRVALANNGSLANNLPGNLADKIFEVINRPEDVSFRYAFFDGGTGHELQNRSINNIAGLGIANGERPFKKLSRPMSFLPRSTIRVQVEERFGRGTLFIAFQGYKLIGTTPQGGRR